MTQNHSFSRLPQFPKPYWQDSVTLPQFSPLAEDIEADVAIVGAGITGLTSGYLLAKQGLKVAIIDAGKLLNNTTSHTTAKVTAQHGLIYDELMHSLGDEQAKLYYEAASSAVDFVKKTVNAHQLDCDFTIEDAYVFTQSADYIPKLENELKAYEKLGIDGEFTTSTSLPFEVKGAIVMKNQAQFHPLKYLKYLIEDIIANGGAIFEHTPAIDIETGQKPKVYTKNGKTVSCQHLIIASHFPFEDKSGFYFARMYADRSYVLAVKTKQAFKGGMYINAEQPTRSIRYTTFNGDKLVLFSGDHHKTGQGIATIKHYEALEAFADETYGIQEISYRWSAQDLTTTDKVPYIGVIDGTNPNIFVATGYRKWGMTHGTAASLMLTDIILGNGSRFEKLYHPQRFHANPDVKNLISTNVDVAKHLIKGKFEMVSRHVDDLNNDEGAIVTIRGERAGAYKDQDGLLHIVDSTCTHMGCELEWNSGERSWDCPCHGSRFSIDGEVIEGPAEKDLKRMERP